MRWLFADPNNSEEMAYRNHTIAKIDAWWKAFADNASGLDAHFSRGLDFDVPAWIANNLQSIDNRIMWEFGPALRQKGHRLVITAEEDQTLQPLVFRIVERAPVISGWEFYPYRLAENLDIAKQAVKARTRGNIDDFRVKLAIGPFNGINLLFASPHCTGSDDKQRNLDAFVATESLLGEEWLNQWVGAVEVDRLPESRRLFGLMKSKSDPSFLPLDRLYPTFSALRQCIVDQLPPEPLFEFLEHGSAEPEQIDDKGRKAIGSVVRREAPIQDDYAQFDDLMIASTMTTDLWMASHCGRRFHSCRFSRHGETFAYIKMDGRRGLAETPFPDRGAIEDAISDAMLPTRTGCTIGGGTGRIYSYIELALTDVNRGVDVIRDVLRKSNVDHRTWILFHDAHLAAEWVGIYDDTPPPPMPVGQTG